MSTRAQSFRSAYLNTRFYDIVETLSLSLSFVAFTKILTTVKGGQHNTLYVKLRGHFIDLNSQVSVRV